MIKLLAIGLVLFACVIGAFGALLLKIGSKKFSFKIKELIKNYKVIAGVALYGISSIIFIWALKYGDLSLLYPFSATTYIWVALFSIKFLKEEMNAWKWLGIAAIIAGVSLIGIGS